MGWVVIGVIGGVVAGVVLAIVAIFVMASFGAFGVTRPEDEGLGAAEERRGRRG